MAYIENRKFRENRANFFVKGILGELDFAHIKVTNATNLEVFVNNLWKDVKTRPIRYKRRRQTVGVFRWVLDRTMSKKSAAVGTGAIVFSPLVDICSLLQSYCTLPPS